ncbi:glutamate receptor 2.9 [Ziziphus jujuba]|uniref:Glutamate receptor n=1 Tax=Ziziphus jujuba TaxID=326968 RepID=A0ABM3IN98_ZIZJJ|nr:glutamate receptor 2.9 [Ziziphus jujuba]
MSKVDPPNLVFSLSFLLFACPAGILVVMAQSSRGTVPVNVGVVLNLTTAIWKMRLSSFNMGVSDFYASHANHTTRLVIHARDSNGDVVGAAAAALDLIKNEVQAIVGPETSMQANFMIGLGDRARVPIISFSAKSPSLTSLRSQYFFRTAKNDSAQVKAISAIVQAFGWREAVPIYVDNEFGEGIIPYLTDALQEVDIRIPYRSPIPQLATDDQIVAELNKLMKMRTRVFIVHMSASLGSQLFAKAKEVGMMDKGYVWIMTDGITNSIDSLDSSAFDSMQGVLGVRTYVPNTKELENFTIRWKTQFQKENPTILNPELDVIGLWAYDSAFALAMAVEQIGGNGNFSFKYVNVSGSSSTDLETIGINQNGPQLARALSNQKFKGLAGDFRLVDGQLQTSILEILNLNGNGRKRIGFWTQKNGLGKMLDPTNRTSYSTSNTSLEPIIWPGDSVDPPKGWEIPIKGKKLQIGIPMKNDDFVNVTYDPIAKQTKNVTGYSIDVFKAALDELPYPVPCDFIPFALPNGTSTGTYNDFVYQVYIGKLDAAVGDITIRANRSLYVDFTLPYTESGVSMVVPIKDSRRKDAWVFLKPLTWDLWLTTGCFFIFIGFAVWVLEHRINEDFRGPPHHQIGTSFWFSFSTMVFAHKERVVSNLARFVVIVWCFVVLILTQSYTASLTSLLTVQQLQPAVNDVNQILKNKQNVAYLENSFVYGILKQLGFDDRNLKTYKSPEELHELFTNKSGNGGIAAAFDETPYLKPFLAKYCDKYTMVEPTFKTNGFAFAFPKDSPIVGDFSRAILKVTEGKKIKDIEDKWFKTDESICPESKKMSSASLGLDSFWGLFLIAGLASTLALIIFLAMFLHSNMHFLKGSDPNASKWERIQLLFGIFNQKDLSSHTFRKSGGSSPNTNCPPTPFSYYTNRSTTQDSPEHSPDAQVTQPTQDTVHYDHQVTFPSPPSSPYDSDHQSNFIFQVHDDHDFNCDGTQTTN